VFRVMVRPQTMDKTTLGTISGQIWLQVGDSCFPCKHDSDMVVALLAYWPEELLKLYASRKRVRCYFLDSPHHLSVSWVGKKWRIRCVRRGGTRPSGVIATKCLLDTTQRPVAVLQALHEAGLKVLRTCQLRGWDNRDVESLRRTAQTLKRIERQRPCISS
jgi:hypothetical protein